MQQQSQLASDKAEHYRRIGAHTIGISFSLPFLTMNFFCMAWQYDITICKLSFQNLGYLKQLGSIFGQSAVEDMCKRRISNTLGLVWLILSDVPRWLYGEKLAQRNTAITICIKTLFPWLFLDGAMFGPSTDPPQAYCHHWILNLSANIVLIMNISA